MVGEPSNTVLPTDEQQACQSATIQQHNVNKSNSLRNSSLRLSIPLCSRVGMGRVNFTGKGGREYTPGIATHCAVLYKNRVTYSHSSKNITLVLRVMKGAHPGHAQATGEQVFVEARQGLGRWAVYRLRA